MSRSIEYEFCMSQFKPAVVALVLLSVITLGWTGWHCLNHPHQMMHFQLAAATKAAALNQTTAQTLGLKLKAVTAAVMQKFGLANEDGVLVLEVAPNSIAYRAGLRPGDEILRAGNVRLDTVNDFERTVNSYKPGSTVKMSLYRRPRTRNLYLQLPKNLAQALAPTPMTQNQIETMAEQLGVPKTQQAVQQALRRQSQGRAVAVQTPLTQNQIETIAEQLGVSKTQQAVQQALQQQNQAQTAAQTPMTQNQVETMAEQLGVPKTQQAVQQALRRQNQGRAAAVLNYGKVAVASTGPGLGYPVSRQFGLSPYFIVYDPAQNSYSVVSNPNAKDLGGQGIQTGQNMVDLGVSNVVAGNFEPNAVRTLHTMRVNAYAGVTGSVQNALNAYAYHQLVPTNTNPIPRTIAAGTYQYQPYVGGNQNLYSGSPGMVVY